MHVLPCRFVPSRAPAEEEEVGMRRGAAALRTMNYGWDEVREGRLVLEPRRYIDGKPSNL